LLGRANQAAVAELLGKTSVVEEAEEFCATGEDAVLFREILQARQIVATANHAKSGARDRRAHGRECGNQVFDALVAVFVE